MLFDKIQFVFFVTLVSFLCFANKSIGKENYKKVLMKEKTHQAKRLAPKDVSPVVVGAIKYTAPHYDKAFNNLAGYIMAIEVSSGKELWIKQIYKNNYNPSLERDVQDIFITSLKVKDNILIIANEKGEVYNLNLTDNSIKKVK